MYKLEYTTYIDAAHHLQASPSLKSKKCLNPHGHRWEIEIRIDSSRLKDGMIVDFGVLEDIIQKRYDHKDLNKVLENPTAEILVRDIWDTIVQYLEAERRRFDRLQITAKESPDSSITYDGGDMSGRGGRIRMSDEIAEAHL